MDSVEMEEGLSWNNFPELVQLNIFRYLDRRSLNNLRQISASARDLIENVHGVHVILPTQREYLEDGENIYTVASVMKISHVLRQMVGKKIHTLDIYEMPPSLTICPLNYFLRFPTHLRHAKLKSLSIAVLHDILSQCFNLRTLEYTAKDRDGSPSRDRFDLDTQVVPSPTTDHRFVTTTNGFPERGYKFPWLKRIILECGYLYTSDWGNMAYVLVALPVLPSLTTFKLIFDPKWSISRNTHLLFLSCLGDLLMKTPSLQTLIIRLSCRTVGADVNTFPIWRALIRKFGSALLKEAVETDAELSLDRVQPLFAAAAHSLISLDSLYFAISNDIENRLFTCFFNHLPPESKLRNVLVDDATEITQGDTLATEAEKMKVYKLFAMLNNDQQNQGAIIRLPAFHMLIGLHIMCDFLPNITLSLNRIMEHVPQLKVLTISKKVKSVGRAYVHFDEQSAQSPFARLEQLCFENLGVGDLRCSAPSIFGLLLQCKNLRYLTVRYSGFNIQTWYDHVNGGLHVSELLRLILSLRKLMMIDLHKVYFALSPVGTDRWNNFTLDAADEECKLALRSIGGIWSQCQEPSRVMQLNGTFGDVKDFDFKFGVVDVTEKFKDVDVDLFLN